MILPVCCCYAYRLLSLKILEKGVITHNNIELFQNHELILFCVRKHWLLGGQVGLK